MEIKQKPKIVVFCAPSGSGKTSVTKGVMARLPVLEFSISAATRLKRGNEKDGVDYYFLAIEAFKEKIANNEFAEWELVYPKKSYYYGTLKSEIERINKDGKVAVLDIDVKGAQKIKKVYGENALLIFIKAPPEEVIKRLEERGTDSPEDIADRKERLPEELKYEAKCDVTVKNIDLHKAIDDAFNAVVNFLDTSD